MHIRKFDSFPFEIDLDFYADVKTTTNLPRLQLILAQCNNGIHMNKSCSGLHIHLLSISWEIDLKIFPNKIINSKSKHCDNNRKIVTLKSIEIITRPPKSTIAQNGFTLIIKSWEQEKTKRRPRNRSANERKKNQKK